jgi:hypothetical protein
LPAKDASGKPSVRLRAQSIAAGLMCPRLIKLPSTETAMLPSACICGESWRFNLIAMTGAIFLVGFFRGERTNERPFRYVAGMA